MGTNFPDFGKLVFDVQNVQIATRDVMLSFTLLFYCTCVVSRRLLLKATGKL